MILRCCIQIGRNYCDLYSPVLSDIGYRYVNKFNEFNPTRVLLLTQIEKIEFPTLDPTIA